MRIPVKYRCGHDEERKPQRPPVSVTDYQDRFSKRLCPECRSREWRRAVRESDRKDANRERLRMLGVVASVMNYLQESPLSPVEERYIRLYTRKYLDWSRPRSEDRR